MDGGVVLADRLLRRMMDLLDNARHCPSGKVPPGSLLRDLAELVPCLWSSFGEYDYVAERGWEGQNSDEDDWPPDFDPCTYFGIDPDLLPRLRYQHPTCHHMACNTARTDVVQFSDFISVRQLHARELYQKAFKPLGVEHIMVVPLPTAPGRSRYFQFHRGPGSGFSETERAMLLLLQPHLYRIYKQAAAFRRTPVRLTTRQLDVLRCVALGMSNDQISDQLVIAPGTVTKHLENIYARLGVSSRTSAIARVFGEDEVDAHQSAEHPTSGVDQSAGDI
jgi:DNA-binding CsgD family transcriptional regulator